VRNISAGMLSHIQQDTTTLCVLWKITRVDGQVMGFTSNTSDIAYDDGSGSIVYRASTGANPSEIKTSSGGIVDSLRIAGIINSNYILEADLISGKYDNASISIMLVNYKDLSVGHISLIVGRIGEVSVGIGSFEAEVRSLVQLLQQKIGRTASPLCQVKEFGDSECGKNISSLTFSSTVTSISSNSTFSASSLSAQPNGKFNLGILTWTSGQNSGLKCDIKSSTGGSIILQEDTQLDISVGDTFTIIAGCDRRFSTCQAYGNVNNFRGFPYIPGNDMVFRIVRQ